LSDGSACEVSHDNKPELTVMQDDTGLWLVTDGSSSVCNTTGDRRSDPQSPKREMNGGKSMSKESTPKSVTGNTPEIFVFEMAPGQDTLHPEDSDYMEGWFWNFSDKGNADPVFGPFASEEAARADAQEKIEERLLFEAGADSELVEIAQAIHAAMRGQT